MKIANEKQFACQLLLVAKHNRCYATGGDELRIMDNNVRNAGAFLGERLRTMFAL